MRKIDSKERSEEAKRSVRRSSARKKPARKEKPLVEVERASKKPPWKNPDALTEAEILQVLTANSGFVSNTARALGVTFKIVHLRIAQSDVLKEAVRAIHESKIDFAESKLTTAIRRGQAWAICFYLKCKGKHRGWVERFEHSGPDGGSIPVKFYDFDATKFPEPPALPPGSDQSSG